MITKQQIIDDIKRVHKTSGKTPSRKLYDKLGIYCSTTLRRAFGSWKKAIEETLDVKIIKTKIIPHACQNCGVQTRNPKFCCQACAAKYNNKLKPKRILLLQS